jgi:hypothetical protein
VKKNESGISEENYENLRALDGGCVHWHMKKAYIGNSEENHENTRALDGNRVHWRMNILATLRKITRPSRLY